MFLEIKGIRKISGGLDFNDQHHRVVSGFLVADVSMLQAYNEVFEKYNIEDGNFRVKRTHPAIHGTSDYRHPDWRNCR